MARRGLVLAALLAATAARAEDGYELWLRYRPLAATAGAKTGRPAITEVVIGTGSPTLRAARDEIARGLRGILGVDVPIVETATRDGALVAGTPARSSAIAAIDVGPGLGTIGNEGFVIRSMKVAGKRATVIAANTDIGVLYGVFRLLQLLQTGQPIDAVSLVEAPRIRHRLLNHWDNLNRTVERGYAGFSLWDWHKLPDYRSPRYTDYARANASIGINGTVLTNVNANATSLTAEYLGKAAALADVFRPYGIRVYLTARFSAPIEIGGLATADPLDPAVAAWWKRKAAEIYGFIPDFGGFLVKANSEGQPGPQDYGRTHADGANLLADAVGPHGGVVMWRAFVYSNEVPDDRAKQAYNEFQPLDGKFRPNVLVQVKNGPIDFQPREPFHPLFGAMPKTPLMMEFQITQEYLGFATHLVYLAPLFEETLRADTWAKGEGSTVARVIDGSLHGHEATGIAGVANIGTRPQLVRLGLRLRELVRLRAPGLGPRADVRRDRRRVDPADVRERPRPPGAGEGDDARLARGRGRLHDAARSPPPDGRGPPLRPRPLGEPGAAGRLDVHLLPPGRRERHRLRSDGRRQQRGGPVLPARGRAFRQPRQGPGEAPALVPSRGMGPPDGLGPHAVGRAGGPLRRGSRGGPPHAGHVALARGPGGRREVRGGAGVPRDPGEGSALVARRLRPLLPDVLGEADYRRVPSDPSTTSPGTRRSPSDTSRGTEPWPLSICPGASRS